MTTFQAPRAGEAILQVEEALARVLAETPQLPSEDVPLIGALGRVLREPVVAVSDAPESDNSAMDGYAIIAASTVSASVETPARLRVVGDAPAGAVSTRKLAAGDAIRIMTGAAVPQGADAVVQVEWTDAGREEVQVFRPVAAGANIRLRGEDMRAGDTVLREGMRIGPAEVAMLAANRRTSIAVGRLPRVAILVTGDELRSHDASPRAGQIVDTNSHLLAALVSEAGAAPLVCGIVPDRLEATVEALRNAAGADVVVTSGGVSVGAFDFVKDALDALGAETKFWQVAMKPGKPVVFSKLGETLVFGLPGNPASCFVSFHLFVRPALRKMLGWRSEQWCAPVARVVIESPLQATGDRRIYFRAHAAWVAGEIVARPLKKQGSGSLTSMASANALVIIEPGEHREAGDLVRAVLVGPIERKNAQ